jgi:hypothetical protein
MLQSHQRLLKAYRRFSIGRVLQCSDPSIPKISESLFPYLTSQGVMCEPLDLLSQLLTTESFKSFHNPRMQNTSSLLEQTVIGDLMRQGVLD